MSFGGIVHDIDLEIHSKLYYCGFHQKLQREAFFHQMLKGKPFIHQMLQKETFYLYN